jgi:hypothetical protein
MKKCKFYNKCEMIKIVKLLLNSKGITDHMKTECFDNQNYKCNYKIVLLNNR